MAKAGYKVFDADCHVFEPPDALDQYIDPKFREALQSYRKPDQATYRPNQIQFKRRLGAKTADTEGILHTRANPTSPRFRAPPRPKCNIDSDERIADMDMEGIDKGMILPTGVGTFCSVDDTELEFAVCQAFHRYMSEFCGPYPDRLHGVLVIPARSINASIAEMKRMAKSRWPVAVFPSLPPGMPLDDPDLDPLWATANDLRLTIALHTFTVIPPYAPGALDKSYFDNYWIARSAAHPWCGMRNMASLLGSGILDRHPNLTVALLEAGQGWLPYWVKRLDEQAAYAPAAVPPDMKKIEDYVAGGRYFQSIELHEGEKMTGYVVEEMGQDLLMFSSDYPHGETWFPEAVDTFLGWKSFDETLKRKMLWDNAIRCFPRAA